MDTRGKTTNFVVMVLGLISLGTGAAAEALSQDPGMDPLALIGVVVGAIIASGSGWNVDPNE